MAKTNQEIKMITFSWNDRQFHPIPLNTPVFLTDGEDVIHATVSSSNFGGEHFWVDPVNFLAEECDCKIDIDRVTHWAYANIDLSNLP